MIILQDHREKCGHHNLVEKHLKDNGYEIKRVRLQVGDYMFPNGNTSVDLKQNITELATDLQQDSLFFNKKYKKCLKYGIKLVVLVEEWVDSINSLTKWKSSYSRINGQYLVSLIYNLKISYGVRFVFCNKNQTGEKLLELLNEEREI